MNLTELYEDDRKLPKYKNIAEAIARGITQGVLQPGATLPTQRKLAAALGVTVGTVTRGYAEAVQRGLAEGVTGRGTFVSTPRPDVDTMPAVRRFPYDFGYISPFEHLNPGLHAAVGRLAEAGDLSELPRYQQPRGLLRHREAGALWAARYGLRTGAEDVLICAGAQHALLVTLMSLFNPGDRIAADPLTYPLLKQLAKRLRLQLVPVRMDASGMMPEALDAACRSGGGIKGLYLMPTCHNPTLARIPEGRRHQIVDICRRHQVLIIEDDVFALALEHNLPPLSALAPELGCFIAATSEALSGGLRIAYLCPPERHLEALERAIACTIAMAPPLMAELATLWICDGTADAVLAAKREEAAARNTLARSVLDGFALETRTTGFFCWLRLPTPWTAAAFAAAARDRGVLVAEGDHFALNQGTPEEGVRIALGGLRERAALEDGLHLLAELLHSGPRSRAFSK